jgi:hypothetical protein
VPGPLINGTPQTVLTNAYLGPNGLSFDTATVYVLSAPANETGRIDVATTTCP